MTPGADFAAEISIRLISAKACGERTKCAASASPGLRSLPKRPWPRSSASSSMRPFQAAFSSLRAAIDCVMRCSGSFLKLAVGNPGLGVKRIDMRFHLRIGRVVLRAGNPAGLGACEDRHLLVLL